MVNTKLVLTTARDLIVEHGWVQGVYGRVDCGFCVMGALHAAADRLNLKRTWNDLICDAERHLETAADLRVSKGFLSAWNDYPERTKADVLLAFDVAIEGCK